VLFVGYQAQGTLGRQLVDGADFVTIFGEKIRVAAQRHTVGGLSAHADQAGLADWYGHFHGRPPVALIHGEDKARERWRRSCAGAQNPRSPDRMPPRPPSTEPSSLLPPRW
jgi:predicted metal-dependent RNase